MTANELANKLDNFYSYVNEPYLLVKTSVMLRQQAQEIDQLKEDISEYQQEIEQLRSDLEDCTCQGGHSEAYLKAKGKL
jgi:peptidoglycan hydrolase CwlO-like protein